MATYIQGVGGYIPQIQGFKPDLNFFSQSMQFKQSKYDAAHNQLSTMYGSMLNAPLLRDKNVQARDEFFKAIDQDIHKLSGMDLSLQQNSSAGEELFNQLVDNKNIVKDMVWTKAWQDEHQRAEAFRNCIDPDKCGGSWWEGGVQALNFQAEEFRSASDDQALAMQNARFTPYQNMMEDAIKLAKEAGISIKVDQLQGGYITTTKNGPQLVGPLSSLFMGKFANDPKYADYYKTKAYVDRKSWIASNAQAYGSVEAAEAAYVTQITSSFTGQMAPAQKELESEYNHTQAQRRQLEDRIRTEGALPGSPLARQYQQMNQAEGEIKDSYDVVRGANRTMDLATGNGASRAAMEHIDNAVAMLYMGQDIDGAAQTLAYRDYEFSMKPDEYALENYRQSNRMSLESFKQQNRMEFEAFKYDLKEQREQQQAMGSDLDNVPTMISDIIGGTSITDKDNVLNNLLGDQGGYKQFMENRTAVEKDVVGTEKSLIHEVIQLSLSKSQSEKGLGTASKDLLRIGDYMFNELAKQDTFEDVNLRTGEKAQQGRNTALKYYQSLSKKYNQLDDAGKLRFMQDYDFGVILNSKNLPNQAYSNLYNNMLLPIMNQKDEGNRVNRDYLGNLWERTADQRNHIQSKEKSLQQLDKWYASTTQDVIKQLRVKSPEYADMLEHYVDPRTGRVRNEKEFADSYAHDQAGISFAGDTKFNARYQMAYNRALGLYRGDKKVDPGFWDYVSSVGDAIGTTLTGIGSLGMSGFDYDSPTDVANWDAKANDGFANQGIHDIWKRAWSKYAKADGGYHFLGAAGMGSKEINGMGFSAVDPSKYKSSATMNTMSFMKDALNGGDGARFQFGSASAGLPSSDKEAQKIFNQIVNDMMLQNSAKDQKRPVLSVVYQDIAGGSDKWSALNIKITNENYLKKYLGSEKSPGFMRQYKDQLMNEGLTVYLNKDKATNGFHMASQNTDIDRVLGYTGEYEFDSHPEYTQDLKLKKLQSGGYEISGNIMAGLNEDGTPNWQPHYNPYHSPLSDPNQIVRDYQSLLQEISIGNASMMKQQTMTHGIKDPAQLR